MADNKSFIQKLFQKYNLTVSSDREMLFEDFVKENGNIVEQIRDKQEILMNNWKIKNRVYDIKGQQIVIPNATVNIPYKAKFNFEKLNLTDLSFAEIEVLPETGLCYDRKTFTISGTPIKSGDFKLSFLFKLKGESDNDALHTKSLLIVINPDPKTLWKNLPCDKSAIFWKKDNESVYGQLGEKRIVAASKRGRSHKNAGSFRDDDFKFKFINKTGWSIVAVADGAGSYPLSREGSRLACSTIIDHFMQTEDLDLNNEFEAKIQEYVKLKDEALLRELEDSSKVILYRAVIATFNKIKEVAEKTKSKHSELFNNPKAKSVLDNFHTTLIFAMFKKYDFGYLILTFGVGDCPIAVMNKEKTETVLLNWLDIGEFGGGTRFVTQTEIFQSREQMATRFNFHIISDFSYLFLMTDGVYDPKFVVEANLGKHEKWIDFLADLHGNNEDKVKVPLDTQTSLAPQICLSKWLDFWDKGNHDDRTLAIVF